MIAMRRRVQGDDGMSLAEVLVGMFLIVAALLALLAGFISSSRSIQSQSLQAKATRIALDRNESLRHVDYDTVVSDTTWVDVTTPDGDTQFQYLTTVVELDSDTALATPGDTSKQVTTQVRWLVRGAYRIVSFTTALSPEPGTVGIPAPSATATPTATPTASVKSFDSLTITPSYTVVNTSCTATQSVVVDAVLTGYSSGELIILTWTDESIPPTHTATMTSVDGTNWRATIAGSSIRKCLSTGQTASITFTAVTSITQTATAALSVQGPPATPLSMTAAPTVTVTSGKINLNNSGPNEGKNQHSVAVSCSITGLDTSATSVDYVRLTYPAPSGNTEVSMTRSTGNGVNPSTWTYTFAADSTEFAIGTAQPFRCNGTRVSDNAQTSSPATNVQITK